MLSPPVPRPLGPMMFAVLGQGLSTGMGFAALGLSLYAQGPALAAAALFGAVGAVCGAAAAGLRLWLDGVPPALPAPLPADALAALLRSALAQAQQERQAARSGSAADRRPAADAVALPAAAAASSTPAQGQPVVPARSAAPAAGKVAAEHRLAGSAVDA